MKSKRNRALLDVLKWFANLGEAPKEWAEFLAKHPGYLKEEYFVGPDDVRQEYFLSLRNQVRKLWRGGEVASEIAHAFLLAKKPHFHGEGEEAKILSPDSIKVDWDRGELVLAYTALDDFQASIYELLRVSRFAKVCAGPGCPAPYFIADKIIQQYCSDECKYEARKEIQKAYWERRGSRVRRERKQRSKAKKRR
jgi:hypothetical protein